MAANKASSRSHRRHSARPTTRCALDTCDRQRAAPTLLSGAVTTPSHRARQGRVGRLQHGFVGRLAGSAREQLRMDLRMEFRSAGRPAFRAKHRCRPRSRRGCRAPTGLLGRCGEIGQPSRPGCFLPPVRRLFCITCGWPKTIGWQASCTRGSDHALTITSGPTPSRIAHGYG